MSTHCWSTTPPARSAVDACEQVSEEDEESSSEVQNSSHFLLLFSLGTDGVTGEVINKGFGLSKMLSVMLTGDAEVDLAYAAVTVLMASFSHSSRVRWRTT